MIPEEGFGLAPNGKPHKVRLYSIASTEMGDGEDYKSFSLCVKRVHYLEETAGI